jgi:multicomponent K+:H+ antiporter subunit F
VSAFFAFAVTFATLCIGTAMVLASVRLFRGPFAQDRVLAFDTFYINGMLILLMQAIRTGSPAYFDIALLIALFGFVGTFALARFLMRREVVEP